MPRVNAKKTGIRWLFLLIGCERFQSLPSLPAHNDIYAFVRLARQTQDAQVEHLLNPQRNDVEEWLSGHIRRLAPFALQDAVLVILVSTHGFEFNGQTCFAWNDSDRNQPHTMTTRSSLQASTSYWFQGHPQRTAILLQQTCREYLPLPAQLPLPVEEPNEHVEGSHEQWSVLAAVPAGQAEEGWETLSQRNRNEYSPAGRLSRRFIDVWKGLTQSIPLPELAKKLDKMYREEGKEPPDWIARDEQLVWPHIQPIQPTPPKDFVGHLFRSLGEEDTLYGRETALRMALGVRYDRDFNQVGWLFSSERTLLVGPSGAGKTSFVRAGLLPRLRKKSLPENVRYIDVSTQGVPSFPEQSNLPNYLFLDQVEGCLLNKSLFDELAKCVQVCKEKSIRLVILLREESFGAWECRWQEKPDMEFANRILLPLMKEEAQEVLYATLPSSCLTPKEKEQLLKEVAQASSQTTSNSTFGTYSPVLLQAATADAWQRREMPEGKRVRSLKDFWREQWQEVIETSPVERTALLAVISAFVPIEIGRASRRRFTEQQLFDWLVPRGIPTADVKKSCLHLVKEHWLQKFQFTEKTTYVLSHDILLPFLFDFLNKDNHEREHRLFFRRIQERLYGAEKSTLKDSLLHFSPPEWKRLRQQASFWWQWLHYEGGTQHSRPPEFKDFIEVLDSLLAQRRNRSPQLFGAVMIFLLLAVGLSQLFGAAMVFIPPTVSLPQRFGTAMVFLSLAAIWLWNASVMSRLISDIEQCTEAFEKTLSFEKFQRGVQALARLETWSPIRRWLWGGQHLMKNSIMLFQKLHGKEAPLNWWEIVPSTLEKTRSLFLSSRLTSDDFLLAWFYLLQVVLEKKSSSRLTDEERAALLNALKNPNYAIRRIVVSVWVLWITKEGEATEQERKAWLIILKEFDENFRKDALNLWKVWIEKTGEATRQERNAWTALLEDSNAKVRSSAAGVWKVWIKKTNPVEKQDRDAWLRINTLDRVSHPEALEVWKEWCSHHTPPPPRREDLEVWKERLKKNGKVNRQKRDMQTKQESWVRIESATLHERDAWTASLKDSNSSRHLAALGAWETWIDATGEVTQQERGTWVALLKDSDYWVRCMALKLWETWIKKTGTATQQEQCAWLALLEDSSFLVRYQTTFVCMAWVEKTGNATQQERDAWIMLLKDSNPSMRTAALQIWQTWVKKTGEATRQERDAWIESTKDSVYIVRRTALMVWEAWVKKTGEVAQQERLAWAALIEDALGRVKPLYTESPDFPRLLNVWGYMNVLFFLKQKGRVVQKLKGWLRQTVAWDEVQGGVEALKEHLASNHQLAKELESSPYPIFQQAAREALVKKANSSSRPTTSKNPSTKTSISPAPPVSRPSSQASTSTSRPSSKP